MVFVTIAKVSSRQSSEVFLLASMKSPQRVAIDEMTVALEPTITTAI